MKLLEESEFKYRAGVVGLLCTLLCADNELEKASQLFTEVYDHYKDDEVSWEIYKEGHCYNLLCKFILNNILKKLLFSFVVKANILVIVIDESSFWLVLYERGLCNEFGGVRGGVS